MPSDRPIRRRRSAASAQKVILDAAQKRLAEGGPEAVRLQSLAADVGVSHPAILHHFGSREGLIQALEARAMAQLRADLLEPITTGEALDRVFSILGNQGHARVLAWWALSNDLPEESEDAAPLLADLASAYHAERVESAQAKGKAEPQREDTEFAVRLAAVALFGEALIGPLLTRSAGLDEDAGDRFRAWMTELFERALE